MDVLSGESRPVRRQLDDLVRRLTSVLEANGDLPAVQRGLRRLDSEGTGADRQRRVFCAGQVEPLLRLLDIGNASAELRESAAN